MSDIPPQFELWCLKINDRDHTPPVRCKDNNGHLVRGSGAYVFKMMLEYVANSDESTFEIREASP